jgi:hypothetical protein
MFFGLSALVHHRFTDGTGFDQRPVFGKKLKKSFICDFLRDFWINGVYLICLLAGMLSLINSTVDGQGRSKLFCFRHVVYNRLGLV